jgi:hypothetical protein
MDYWSITHIWAYPYSFIYLLPFFFQKAKYKKEIPYISYIFFKHPLYDRSYVPLSWRLCSLFLTNSQLFERPIVHITEFNFYRYHYTNHIRSNQDIIHMYHIITITSSHHSQHWHSHKSKHYSHHSQSHHYQISCFKQSLFIQPNNGNEDQHHKHHRQKKYIYTS